MLSKKQYAPSAPTEGTEVQEEHHLEKHPALQFHKAVVGHRIREVTLEMSADKVQVVVLEIVECSEMEHNQNRHNYFDVNMQYPYSRHALIRARK